MVLKINLFEVSMNNEAQRIKEVYGKRKAMGANKYSIFFSQQRKEKIKEIIIKSGCTYLANKKILEVGCGEGEILSYFIEDGTNPENLYGIDLLLERIEKAKKNHPKMNFLCADAEKLPYLDNFFDLVIQSTVFTSILDPEMKKKIASEMLRVLKSDGIIIWHDFRFNNPLNPDVKGIRKREIMNLFPNCQFDFELMNLNPFIARPLTKFSWKLCQWLEKIPFLRTHWLVAITKL